MTPLNKLWLAPALALFSLSAAATPIDSIANSIVSVQSDIIRFNGMAEAEAVRSENVLPDPQAELEHLWGTNLNGNKLTIGVSQEFELPMAYRSRSRLASALTARAQAQADVKKAEVRYQARQLLIRIAYGQQIASRYDSSAVASGRRVLLLQGLLDKGEITRLDFYKARKEWLSALRSAELQRRDLTALQGELAALNNGIPVDCSHITLPEAAPLLPWSAYEEQCKALDPQNALTAADRLANKCQTSVVRATRWPSLSLGYIYNCEIGDKFHGFNVGLSLPFYSRKSKQKATLWPRQQLLATCAPATPRLHPYGRSSLPTVSWSTPTRASPSSPA